MSNLIKSPFIKLSNENAVLIEHKEDENFVPLQKPRKVIMKSLDEVELQEEKKENTAIEKSDGDAGEFEPGVPVINLDEVILEKQKQADEMAEEILSKAREEANKLISEAQNDFESIKEQARNEGIEMGRQEGLEIASTQIDEMKKDLQERKEEQEFEYTKMIEDVERKYVDVLCALLQKLTGVVITDKKDIILHLIRSSLASMDAAKKYIIRVSGDDFYSVEAKKDQLLEGAGINNASIEVQEEKGLEKDECIIETDTQMVDCGFKTQLENLITALRMLA